MPFATCHVPRAHCCLPAPPGTVWQVLRKGIYVKRAAEAGAGAGAGGGGKGGAGAAGIEEVREEATIIEWKEGRSLLVRAEGGGGGAAAGAGGKKAAGGGAGGGNKGRGGGKKVGRWELGSVWYGSGVGLGPTVCCWCEFTGAGGVCWDLGQGGLQEGGPRGGGA